MQRLRGVVFGTFIYGCGILIGGLGAPLLLLGEKGARALAKTWVRTAMFALKNIAGISYRIEGAEHLPTTGALVAANHQSMWETIVLYALLPRPAIVYKKELSYLPFYGWVVSCGGNIPVDRKGGAKALRTMREAAAARVEAGCQVIVFPEGTRIPPGETAPYLPGVAAIYTGANAPCTPVSHDSGKFWRYPSIRKKPGMVTLRFLPALAPGLDRKKFMATLKDKIDGARPDLALQNDTIISSDG